MGLISCAVAPTTYRASRALPAVLCDSSMSYLHDTSVVKQRTSGCLMAMKPPGIDPDDIVLAQEVFLRLSVDLREAYNTL